MPAACVNQLSHLLPISAYPRCWSRLPRPQRKVNGVSVFTDVACLPLQAECRRDWHCDSSCSFGLSPYPPPLTALTPNYHHMLLMHRCGMWLPFMFVCDSYSCITALKIMSKAKKPQKNMSTRSHICALPNS